MLFALRTNKVLIILFKEKYIFAISGWTPRYVILLLNSLIEGSFIKLVYHFFWKKYSQICDGYGFFTIYLWAPDVIFTLIDFIHKIFFQTLTMVDMRAFIKSIYFCPYSFFIFIVNFLDLF